MNEYHDLVRTLAESLELVDRRGGLLPLDSLMVIDLVASLEDTLKIRIPPIELEPDVFESIESVAEMVARVRAPSVG